MKRSGLLEKKEKRKKKEERDIKYIFLISTQKMIRFFFSPAKKNKVKGETKQFIAVNQIAFIPPQQSKSSGEVNLTSHKKKILSFFGFACRF